MKYVSGVTPILMYVYIIDDEKHRGIVKVGHTTYDGNKDIAPPPNSETLNEAAHKRIKNQTQTAAIDYKLLYTESLIYTNSQNAICSLDDHCVHDVLIRSGIKRKEFENNAREWYECDLETVKNAIKAAKEGRTGLHPAEIEANKINIVLREEQQRAVEMTENQFNKGNRMLWNAKMRFGKTLSALQLIKRNPQYKRTIIITHRPVVDDSWFDDYNKLFADDESVYYGSKAKGNEHSALEALCNAGKGRYIYFASIQDLRGAKEVGGKFDKNDEIFNSPWDLLIVDEAHEGNSTELGIAVRTKLIKRHTKLLELSGTPYNIIEGYNEDEIFTWDYVMEQRAKAQWDQKHPGEPNPYAELPRMNILTFNLGQLVYGDDYNDLAFTFNEFFKVNSNGHFVRENDIKKFLTKISSNSPTNLYPFASSENRTTRFRHTLWMLPGVKEAKALEEILEKQPVFDTFKIVNVAGIEEVDGQSAIERVKNAIGTNPELTRTITLSCGKLTTGVSIKPWKAVLMLSGGVETSAAAYMQTIFRVQTPFKDKDGKILKHDCYVYDFAPDRTLRVIADALKVSPKAGQQTAQQREAITEFINFCPIISVEGGEMRPLDTTKMLTRLKSAYTSRVIANGFDDNFLYNDSMLMNLSSIEAKDFNKLKGIIGKTKAMQNVNSVEINGQGFSEEQHSSPNRLSTKRELTAEEKARREELKKKKKVKEDAISILRGISIRMPLLIYGATITDEDKELTIDNFTSLVDPKSWEEFMPKGVSKQRFNAFKKYYDPDIFTAAAKRIRAMARAADRFSIEERIERVAAIFSTFRNPDKETVLTPWRVVNMHMSDCLGGYTFFNEDFTETIEEPRYVERGSVTDDVFAPESHLLEINSKSGLYPLYLAYNIYRARLRDEMFFPETLEEHQAIWDKSVAENIFVICKTPMAESITRRTLLGFRKGKTNMWAPDGLINKIKNQPELFIRKVHNLVGKNVKIKAIVGNPPYQVMDGGAGVSAKPVYNLFVDMAKTVKPSYISMIMPAKWFSDGKGLGSFRSNMFTDRRLSAIFDFVDSRDCFSNVDIAGGVCYFLWDSKANGNCLFTTLHRGERTISSRNLSEMEEFIRHSEAVNIVENVKNSTSKFFDQIVSTQKPFGLRTYVVPMETGDIMLKYNKGKGPYDSSLIDVGRNMIPQWKIIISCLTAEHAGQTDKEGRKKILSSLDMLQPNEICTETYMVVGSYNTEYEANNLSLYLRTRFVRFLIAQLAATQHLSKEKFALVPDQDFTEGSDIDWSKSVADIDKQLYAKYGLSADEIAFIESMIKPM